MDPLLGAHACSAPVAIDAPQLPEISKGCGIAASREHLFLVLADRNLPLLFCPAWCIFEFVRHSGIHLVYARVRLRSS